MTNRRSLRNILKGLEQGDVVNQRPVSPRAPRPPRQPLPHQYRQRQRKDGCWQSAIKIDLARRNPVLKLQPTNLTYATRAAARLNNNTFKYSWDKSQLQNGSPSESISFKYPPTKVVDRLLQKNRQVQQMDTLSPFTSLMAAEAPPHSQRIRPDSRGCNNFERTNEITSVVHQITIDSETTTNVSATSSCHTTFNVPSRKVTLCIQVLPSNSIEPSFILLGKSPSHYMQICQAADNSLVDSGNTLYTTKFTGTHQIKNKARSLEIQMRRKRSTALSQSNTLFSFPASASEFSGDEGIYSFNDWSGLGLNDIDESMQSWMNQNEEDTVWPDTPKSQRQVAKKARHDTSDDINMSNILANNTMVRLGNRHIKFRLFNLESKVSCNINFWSIDHPS